MEFWVWFSTEQFGYVVSEYRDEKDCLGTMYGPFSSQEEAQKEIARLENLIPDYI